jgi:uncharacterized protein
MDKKYYALKLIPNRPNFAQNMTDEERAAMHQHVAYWKALMDKGKVVVFGPVLDPKEVYGLGVIEAESDDEVKTFIAKDPAIKINTYEFYPMRAIVKS